MESNTDLDEVLISYLLNELTPGQEALIVKWIDANEANRHYFDQLKKTVRLVGLKRGHEKINIQNEWIHFNELLASKEQETGIDAESEMPESISIASGYRQKRPAVIRRFVSVAIAASILLLIGFGWKMFTGQKQQEALASVKVEKTSGNSRPLMRHEVNSSEKPKNVVLPDGSEVILEKQSELTFSEPFAAYKREVTLSGKANFRVAKDQLKPFTVFSGDISTTALGTSFTVTSYKNANRIVVRLYEGKVVISSVDNVKRKLKNKYYLLPGQELVYDHIRSLAKVRGFKVKSEAKVRSENSDYDTPVLDDPSIPHHDMESWYMFNNQSLSQVFEQLKVMYDADIVYDKKDIQKMYFIGRFSKSESVENILKQITALNNLTVNKKNNRYLITKKVSK